MCGFLHLIKELADRGCNIGVELAFRGATLQIPEFTKGIKQLSSAKGIEHSHQLAHVQIHVERVIGQLKKKYTILKGTLPILTKECTIGVP